MKGSYNITLLTPIGPEKGTIFLNTEGEKLSGILKILGNEKEFTGVVKGNSIEFTSELKKLVKKIPFTAKCTVNGDTLEGYIDSQFGEIKIIGKKA
ncbi:hypothetical protein [Alkaliphilus peptidifermentans]|uniref:Uncharacterized protein n=1 Tax=Alkaliphilus peptidifermentans DSM 18978 TaxID=1120976 RepID=A0A1G5IKG9_9FIRM|nr:hypothetical protein [Alkaliphilus peptidifermentans]SCY76605.1 hypothetical protein SAMN03080606_02433 [Alkaliphilus peptidifermentans DSM 18978]